MPNEVQTRTRRATSGSEKRQRRASVPVRYSDDERAELHRRAERSGLSAAAYIRMMTLEATPPRARRRPSLEEQHLARILGQIGKIGSNINQLARLGNSGEFLPEWALDEALADLARMRVVVVEALGHGDRRD